MKSFDVVGARSCEAEEADSRVSPREVKSTTRKPPAESICLLQRGTMSFVRTLLRGPVRSLRAFSSSPAKFWTPVPFVTETIGGGWRTCMCQVEKSTATC
jgi:hypothetical protein